jgi:hypothetical protein
MSKRVYATPVHLDVDVDDKGCEAAFKLDKEEEKAALPVTPDAPRKNGKQLLRHHMPRLVPSVSFKTPKNLRLQITNKQLKKIITESNFHMQEDSMPQSAPSPFWRQSEAEPLSAGDSTMSSKKKLEF